ncbi:hypothetical protein L3Q82_001944 [Scortum barcoo]|uniref:Uncharacterized protein n=1 Tax=Scortum barcoo TaxID=214431 RepID=A0ACB8W2L0_9TELE|nr:hypothetical protein L3Q82_001944 [Scortum barcoo]
MRRKKVKSKIVTDTPEKMELEEAQKEKEYKMAEKEKKKNERQKKRGNKKRGALKEFKPTKPKTKVVVSSSSEESDISIPLNNTTDYDSSDVQNDDDDGNKDLSAGDFVIVNFAGKNKSYNYVGLVEKVDGADISAKFLRRSKRSLDGKPIFSFKENDEGVISREDVRKKLPTPQKLGGTARREQKFIFPCSIDKWDVVY